MKRFNWTSVALIVGLMVACPLVGCDDDDNEVRDHPDGAYYEQQPTYQERPIYRGDHAGVKVEVYRSGDDDDDDDWDDDDDDDRRRYYYRDDDDDDDNDDWDDDDDD